MRTAEDIVRELGGSQRDPAWTLFIDSNYKGTAHYVVFDDARSEPVACAVAPDGVVSRVRLTPASRCQHQLP